MTGKTYIFDLRDQHRAAVLTAPTMTLPHTKEHRTTKACRHRGEKIGETRCASCGAGVKLHLFECAVFRQCTIGKQSTQDDTACCATCPRYVPATAGGA